jgi:hypothetical protein
MRLAQIRLQTELCKQALLQIDHIGDVYSSIGGG